MFSVPRSIDLSLCSFRTLSFFLLVVRDLWPYHLYLKLKSGASVSLTPLIPATPAPAESDVSPNSETVVPSPSQPAGAPTLPGDESFEDLLEYDSDGTRTREERRGATPALNESLRYVSRDSYPIEDMWLEDGNIAIIHPFVECDGLRVLARPPPPLTA
jgi:hypothetical protein